MSTVLIKAENRREKGSRSSRRLRRVGRVPAVVYGMGADPLTVSVDSLDLRSALSGEAGVNAIVSLDVDGAKHLSIVKELQRHPVRSDVVHVDFMRIDTDSEVEVEVPLVLTGEAKKVTQASGMVDQVLHHLLVRVKIGDIPAQVTADVSELEVGFSLRVADIDLPPGVTPADDPEAPFAVGLITRSTKEYLRQLKAETDESALPAGEPGA